MAAVKGLLERLQNGEGVIVGEGYLFELEARGYLKAGAFVPEILLEHPDVVKNLHREFVHAGSDVVLALTYYAHREKLRVIGREDDLEKIQRTALKIARDVAEETGTLVAGNVSNSTIYKKNDPKIEEEIYNMLSEQVCWALEEGVDFIVGETFSALGEARLALKAIKEFGKGCPCVITLVLVDSLATTDGVPFVEACHLLKQEGADVVGLNCYLGPQTMLPKLQELCNKIQGPIAGLPVVYRTDKEKPVMTSLCDIDNPELQAFPSDLGPYMCSRRQIADFSRAAWNTGVHYLGLCCGNRPSYLRTMAEAVGRIPPASRFSPDMSQHFSQLQDERHAYLGETLRKTFKK